MLPIFRESDVHLNVHILVICLTHLTRQIPCFCYHLLLTFGVDAERPTFAYVGELTRLHAYIAAHTLLRFHRSYPPPLKSESPFSSFLYF